MPEHERVIGRAAELEQLGKLLESDRAAVVVGEAGVGKTSVVRAAVFADGRESFEGGALSTLSWMAYLPIQRALGAGPGSTDAVSVAQLVERTVGPGILMVDDLQWADAATLEVLTLLVGTSCVVTAVRTGDPGSERALATLERSGYSRLDLDALGPASSADVVRRRAPGMTRARVERIVARSGGNPLLLTELAIDEEPSADLRLVIEARVRKLTVGARRTFGLLALAGRPMPLDGIDTVVEEELGAAGLGAAEGNDMMPRHALIAETYLETLPADERRALHAELAERLDDAGEVARHHAAAGNRRAAHSAAIQALEEATLPVERAEHLALAAETADDKQAVDLRLRAARALSDIGAHARAASLLAGVESRDPADLAAIQLVRVNAARHIGDHATVAQACASGLGIAAGIAPEVEVRLRIACAGAALDNAMMFQGDRRAARAQALQATAAAERLGRHRAEARLTLGQVKLMTREPGWRENLILATEAAREDGQISTEFAARGRLAFGLLIEGRPGDARDVATALAERASALGLPGAERAARAQAVGAMWHASGPAAEVMDAAEDLLIGAGSLAARRSVAFYVGQAFADAGRLDEARSLVDDLVATAHPSWDDLGNALWCRADVEYWSGRAREAVAVADEALTRFGRTGPTSFLQVSRAWALVDVGRVPDHVPDEDDRPIIAGAIPEVEALRRLATGHHADAVAVFRRAAEAWAGRHMRGELRSRWGEGEALRRSGAGSLAIERLLKVETRAEQLGFVPLLGRIRRSLRLLGVRRSVPRRMAVGLTERERELLELAGAGQTSADIARRLGVGRPTVDRIIASAMLKLGAETRVQAAALIGDGGAA